MPHQSLRARPARSRASPRRRSSGHGPLGNRASRPFRLCAFDLSSSSSTTAYSLPSSAFFLSLTRCRARQHRRDTQKLAGCGSESVSKSKCATARPAARALSPRTPHAGAETRKRAVVSVCHTPVSARRLLHPRSEHSTIVHCPFLSAKRGASQRHGEERLVSTLSQRSCFKPPEGPSGRAQRSRTAPIRRKRRERGWRRSSDQRLALQLQKAPLMAPLGEDASSPPPEWRRGHLAASGQHWG